MLSKTLALNEIVLNDNNLQPNYIASFKGKPLFYRTRVRSLAMLVTNSLTDSLNWCDPGVWRWQLCWWWKTCWQQFVADLEAEVLVIKLNFCSDFEHKVWSRLKLRRDFEAEVWSVFYCWCLVEVTKLNLCQDSDARFGQDSSLNWVEMLMFGLDFEVNA